MLDLNNWNLTVPEQVPALTIPATLVKAGYQSKYFYRAGSALFFWAPVTGTSTGGSTYPRSELRETLPDGKHHNWLFPSGSHYLKASLEVAQVPSTGKIVIGQIHCKDNPTPYLKIVYQQTRGVGYVNVELRQKPGDVKSPIVMSYKSMPLNTRFDYSINVTKAGSLRVDIGGMTYTGKIDPAWTSKHFYFKAGVYTLDNVGPATEGGKALFHALSMGHKFY
ncbi:MAG: polysaccharide lyase family 7 protein [Pseudomonadota bacterium]